MSRLSLVALLFTSTLSVLSSPVPAVPVTDIADIPSSLLQEDPTSIVKSLIDGSGSSPLQMLDDLPLDGLIPKPSSSSGLVTLPMARRFNSTGASNVLKFDQARAKAFKTRGATTGTRAGSAGALTFRQAAVFDAPATNQAVDYTTTVSTSFPRSGITGC